MTAFEHGYPGAEQDRWCVRGPYASETLCGRLVDTRAGRGYFPPGDLQPTAEDTQCRACKVKLAELAAATLRPRSWTAGWVRTVTAPA